MAIAQKKTDDQLNELRTFVQELRASQAETDKQIMKMSKKIDDLGEKFGGLGEKFGGFTEGMAFPSMEKILRERFKMDVVSLNVKILVKISKKIGKYLVLAIDGCQARMALA